MESSTVSRQSEYRNEIDVLRKKKLELLTKACKAKGSDYINLINEIREVELNTKMLNLALSKLIN
ncbi:hypothetical protein [Leclercia adecarboxylata]|uniref:hypothetical protein n=1 Tax=Leclercia adecarboxylata TaxID=83655 RepID=UPI0030196345